MKEVDYAKLSQQYAGFLVAAGGVSITALTIVLGLKLSSDSPTRSIPPTAKAAQLFMVAALIVAIVSSFAGAHMLAETAAFFSHLQEKTPTRRPRHQLEKGQRLFLLATSHIFITIGLVLFAIVLLPTATGIEDPAAVLKPISHAVFVGTLLGSLIWMGLSATERATVKGVGWCVIWSVIVVGIVTGLGCWLIPNHYLPQVVFTSIALLIVASLIYFAITFRSSRVIIGTRWLSAEIILFSSAVTFSYVCLVGLYLKILVCGAY